MDGGEDSGSEDSGSDAASANGSFGAPCTNVGGSDPACTGVYDLCENVMGMTICTKACTYSGGGGPVSDPADCPSPPTLGECTPKGFCK